LPVAPKKREKSAGSEVQFQLACRRGFHVDQRVGRDDDGAKFFERTMVSQYATRLVSVPQPDFGVTAEEIECPFCTRTVRLQVASDGVVAFRKYRPALITLVLAPFVVVPCLMLPAVQKAAVSAAGTPYLFGLIAAGVFAVVFLFALIAAILERNPELRAVSTRDFKHRILPADYESI
jgi:hypothetical protein